MDLQTWEVLVHSEIMALRAHKENLVQVITVVR